MCLGRDGYVIVHVDWKEPTGMVVAQQLELSLRCCQAFFSALLFHTLHHYPRCPSLNGTDADLPDHEQQSKRKAPAYALNCKPHKHTKYSLQSFVIRIPQLPRTEDDLHRTQGHTEQRKEEQNNREKPLETRCISRLELIEMPAPQMYCRVEVQRVKQDEAEAPARTDIYVWHRVECRYKSCKGFERDASWGQKIMTTSQIEVRPALDQTRIGSHKFQCCRP